MNRIRSKRDPPSASSIILGNDETPRFSLNERQKEILANRERRQGSANEPDNRPFATKSNRTARRHPNESMAEQKAILVKESSSRSLIPGNRSKHSLLGNRAKPASSAAEDGGLLRRVLEQANQHTRHPSNGRSVSSSRHYMGGGQSTVASADVNHRGGSSVRMDPEEVSTRTRDPIETRRAQTSRVSDDVAASVASLASISNRSQKKNADRVTAMRVASDENSTSMNGQDVSDEATVSSTSDVKLEPAHRIGSSESEEAPTSIEEKSVSSARNDDQSVKTARSNDRSVSLSVRMKLQEKKRRAQTKPNLKKEALRPTRNDQHSVKSSDVRTRQMISEKMRQRKGSAARSREEAPQNEAGFEDFCKTLEHEAVMSNSQLWGAFSALMEGRRAPKVVPKRVGKGYKFDPDTRRMLSVMNLHLRSMDSAAYENETQLVNDKALEKYVHKERQLQKKAAKANASLVAKKRVSSQASRTHDVSNDKNHCSRTDAGGGKDDLKKDEQEHKSDSSRSSSNSFSGHGKIDASSASMTSSSLAQGTDGNDANSHEIIDVEQLAMGRAPTAKAENMFDKKPEPPQEIIDVENIQNSIESEIAMPIPSVRSDNVQSSSESESTTPLPAVQVEEAPTGSPALVPREEKEKNEDEHPAVIDIEEIAKMMDEKQQNSIKESPRPEHPRDSNPGQNSTKIVTSTAPATDEIINLESIVAEDAEQGSNDHSFEVTLKDFETKVGTPKSSKKEPPAARKGPAPVPWTNIRLRSVADSSHSDQNAQTPPAWAAVALRKVKPEHEPLPEKVEENTEKSALPEGVEVIDLGEVSTVGPSRDDGKVPSKDEKHQSMVVESSGIGTEQTPIPVTKEANAFPDGATSEKAEEKNSRPSQPGLNGENIMFKLRSTPPRDHRVVIGKQSVMVLSLSLAGGGSEILWQKSRATAIPIAFDMSIQQVKLGWSDSDDEKVLQFRKTDDCLKFTNLFYNQAAGPIVGGTETEELDDDDFASVRMERVNEKEQQMLERFRSLPKDAQEALHETINIEDATEQSGAIKAVGQKLNSSRAQTPSVAIPGFPELIDAQDMPTSPVSTFSASVALSVDEQEVAKKYNMMLKIGVPSDGVLDKMHKDNVDDRIIHFVLGDSNETKSTMTEQEKTAEQYKKMLSMGVPIEAVRHKMTKDQVEAGVVELVVGASSPVETESLPALTEQEETKATKYRKMLKIGLEKTQVLHSMHKDQVEQKIIDAVLGTVSSSSVSSDSASSSSGKQQQLKGMADFSEEEQALVMEYKRLLKRQVPREQVESRMRHEGASEKIICFVLGIRSGRNGADDQSARSRGSSSKLVSLHWTPLSGDQLNNSVFKGAKALNSEDADPSKLVELFQKKPSSGKQKAQRSDDSVSVTSKARLLDLNRSNNVAISLKAYKDFTYAELATIIEYLDPSKRLESERIPFLRDLLPTQAEIKAVMEYTGPNERLVPAELWFRQIAKIKRIGVKVNVMRTIEMFDVEAKSVGETLRLLTRVCNQVMASEKLQDLLAMVLAIGNIMNEGTRTGRAAGFKFDSLLKLTQTKSTDGTTTVLDYLVTLYVGKNQKDTLNLISDFPSVQTASRMLLSDLVSEVNSIKESLEQCKNELRDLKRDLQGGKPNTNRAKPKVQGNADMDPRAALLQSLGGGMANLGTKKAFSASRDTFEKSKPSVDDEVSQVGKKDKNSSSSAIERLEVFVQKATVSLSDLERTKREALDTSKELARFCGEGSNTGATSTVLGILYEFTQLLQTALEKYEKQCAAAARRKKNDNNSQKPAADEDDGSQSIPSSEGGKSLVLMVSEMLKNANERTREDFKKGRVSLNPSEGLQAIYDRENDSRRRKTKNATIDQESPSSGFGRQQEAEESTATTLAPFQHEVIVCNDEDQDQHEIIVCDDIDMEQEFHSIPAKQLSDFQTETAALTSNDDNDGAVKSNRNTSKDVSGSSIRNAIEMFEKSRPQSKTTSTETTPAITTNGSHAKPTIAVKTTNINIAPFIGVPGLDDASRSGVRGQKEDPLYDGTEPVVKSQETASDVSSSSTVGESSVSSQPRDNAAPESEHELVSTPTEPTQTVAAMDERVAQAPIITPTQSATNEQISNHEMSRDTSSQKSVSEESPLLSPSHVNAGGPVQEAGGPMTAVATERPDKPTDQTAKLQNDGAPETHEMNHELNKAELVIEEKTSEKAQPSFVKLLGRKRHSSRPVDNEDKRTKEEEDTTSLAKDESSKAERADLFDLSGSARRLSKLRGHSPLKERLDKARESPLKERVQTSPRKSGSAEVLPNQTNSIPRLSVSSSKGLMQMALKRRMGPTSPNRMNGLPPLAGAESRKPALQGGVDNESNEHGTGAISTDKEATQSVKETTTPASTTLAIKKPQQASPEKPAAVKKAVISPSKHDSPGLSAFERKARARRLARKT